MLSQRAGPAGGLSKLTIASLHDLDRWASGPYSLVPPLPRPLSHPVSRSLPLTFSPSLPLPHPHSLPHPPSLPPSLSLTPSTSLPRYSSPPLSYYRTLATLPPPAASCLAAYSARCPIIPNKARRPRPPLAPRVTLVSRSCHAHVTLATLHLVVLLRDSR